MNRLQVTHPEAARDALRQMLDSSPQSRFEHRLHCVLLVSAGHGCHEVAKVFGDDARTVQRWVQKFLRCGTDGLRDTPPPGRRAKLTVAETAELGDVLKQPPGTFGHAAEVWRSDLLRNEIARRFAVAMSRRHCQRLLMRLSPAACRGTDRTSQGPQSA